MDFIQTDSGTITNRYIRSACKGYTIYGTMDPYWGFAKRARRKPIEPKKVPFLTIHGNIAYDFLYRSQIDSPYSQPELQQHTERVYLNVLIKGKYPIKVAFTTRQSNSPYFKNYFDVNFQFDKYGYNKNLKQDLITKLSTKLLQRPDLDSIDDQINKYSIQYHTLQNSIENPSTLQKIIEEKELASNPQLSAKNYLPSVSTNTPAIPTIVMPADNKFKFKQSDTAQSATSGKIDSTEGKYREEYEKEKKELDSLALKLKRLQYTADSIRNVAQSNLLSAKQKVYNATNDYQLQKIAADNGVQMNEGDKVEKQLSAIKTLAVGKSMLNYTELTAQNITITGLNVEYNPSYYAAFAAGKVNYNFQDFFNSASIIAKTSGQYIVLGRYGFGNIEKRALIFTLFQGRKSQSQYTVSDTANTYISVLGYSVEAISKMNKNTIVSAEFAKSTEPVTGSLNAQNNDKQTKALWDYGDKSNMAINFKAETGFPETNTKLSGFYRKSGANFQSFSLFSYNTDQTAWQARVDQSFYKNEIGITGMLRRNDFTNPLVGQTYNTSTVFKSILLNLRFPKYPTLSVGYYPGTQLYVVNNQQLSENAYYILNGSLVYSYRYKHIGMNTSLIYNRYFSQATDSGLVLYRGVTYNASQTLFFNKLQLHGGYTYNLQSELCYYTIETSATYSLKSWLKIGLGTKYNRVANGADYLGGDEQITADFKKMGGFQLQYDKSYLPTTSNTLYPVEIGRVSWYKYF